jgi:hypothetical protein
MKNENRDDFSSKTVGILKQRAAFLCSNPDCRCLTIAASDTDDKKVIFNGVASHITSAAPGGPRYDASLTEEQRSDINNAIFLCANCSIMIDKNNGLDYTAEKLNEWRLAHEKWTKENLNKKIGNEPPRTVINVTSNGQTGGITAGIVNIGDPQRRMATALKSETDKVFPDVNEKISISYVSGNQEAMRFATEIQAYLEAKGFKIPGLGSFMRMPEVFGLKVETLRNNGGRHIMVGFKE